MVVIVAEGQRGGREGFGEEIEKQIEELRPEEMRSEFLVVRRVSDPASLKVRGEVESAAKVCLGLLREPVMRFDETERGSKAPELVVVTGADGEERGWRALAGLVERCADLVSRTLILCWRLPPAELGRRVSGEVRSRLGSFQASCGQVTLAFLDAPEAIHPMAVAALVIDQQCRSPLDRVQERGKRRLVDMAAPWAGVVLWFHGLALDRGLLARCVARVVAPVAIQQWVLGVGSGEELPGPDAHELVDLIREEAAGRFEVTESASRPGGESVEAGPISVLHGRGLYLQVEPSLPEGVGGRRPRRPRLPMVHWEEYLLDLDLILQGGRASDWHRRILRSADRFIDQAIEEQRKLVQMASVRELSLRSAVEAIDGLRPRVAEALGMEMVDCRETRLTDRLERLRAAIGRLPDRVTVWMRMVLILVGVSPLALAGLRQGSLLWMALACSIGALALLWAGSIEAIAHRRVRSAFDLAAAELAAKIGIILAYSIREGFSRASDQISERLSSWRRRLETICLEAEAFRMERSEELDPGAAPTASSWRRELPMDRFDFLWEARYPVPRLGADELLTEPVAKAVRRVFDRATLHDENPKLAEEVRAELEKALRRQARNLRLWHLYGAKNEEPEEALFRAAFGGRHIPDFQGLLQSLDADLRTIVLEGGHHEFAFFAPARLLHWPPREEYRSRLESAGDWCYVLTRITVVAGNSSQAQEAGGA